MNFDDRERKLDESWHNEGRSCNCKKDIDFIKLQIQNIINEMFTIKQQIDNFK